MENNDKKERETTETTRTETTREQKQNPNSPSSLPGDNPQADKLRDNDVNPDRVPSRQQ